MKRDSNANPSFTATIDGLSDEFEQRWLEGAAPSIEDYLARFPNQAELRKALLLELVAVDIEYQWQRPERAQPSNGQRGARPLLDAYAARFPEFPPLAELPIPLVRAEYRARRLHGDSPTLADYQRRFSAPTDSIAAALADVEAEITAQSAGGTHSATGSTPSDPTLTVSRAELLSTKGPASTAGKSADLGQTLALPTVKTVAHFELVEPLGTGAFGSVYKARDKKLGRTVAIKIPRKEQLGPADVEMFLREARVGAQLDHDNIVRVYEVGKDGETVYIATQLIRGVTLADWISAKRPTERETAELGRKLALALHYAHEKRVIHRDFKPGNILIDQEGEPHITDFGLAKREVGEDSLNAQGPMGAPAYMSPEQAKGEGHTVDGRTDIYSLGVVLFELLTGERPFRGSVSMLMHQVMTEDAPSPRKFNSNVSRDMETIVLKCLEREPKNRPGTAAELADVLSNYLKGGAIPWRPIGRIQRAWRWCLRNRAVAALSASWLLLLTALAIWGIWRSAGLQQLLHEEEKKLSQETTEREKLARELQTHSGFPEHSFNVYSDAQAEVKPDLVLRFGLYESLKWGELQGKFRPLLQHLAEDVKKRTGKSIHIVATIFTDDYEGTIRRLAHGDLDFVRFGPAPYVAARQIQPGIQLLGIELEDGDREHAHDSYIFVKSDSGIESLSQLRNKRIAFADRYSTSTIVFKAALAAEGITKDDVNSTNFKQHGQVTAAVASGECDAGLVRYTHFNEAMRNHPGKLTRLATLRVPNKPYLARAGLPPAILSALRQSLLHVNRGAPEQKIALDALEVDGFAAASPDEYNELENVLRDSKKFDGN
jgi:serine/threonine protein kinase